MIPPLVIGRIGFDNYLIYKAKQRTKYIIDATKSFNIFHPIDTNKKLKLEDRRNSIHAKKQLSLISEMKSPCTIYDSNYILKNGFLKKNGRLKKAVKKIIYRWSI